jgi:hypothetical protein
MPKVVITHAVKDVGRWLSFKDERAAALSAFVTDVTDHANTDGSNSVAVTMDVHDMAAFQGLMASPSPELAAAMERHGVIPPLTAFIAK